MTAAKEVEFNAPSESVRLGATKLFTAARPAAEVATPPETSMGIRDAFSIAFESQTITGSLMGLANQAAVSGQIDFSEQPGFNPYDHIEKTYGSYSKFLSQFPALERDLEDGRIIYRARNPQAFDYYVHKQQSDADERQHLGEYGFIGNLGISLVAGTAELAALAALLGTGPGAALGGSLKLAEFANGAKSFVSAGQTTLSQAARAGLLAGTANVAQEGAIIALDPDRVENNTAALAISAVMGAGIGGSIPVISRVVNSAAKHSVVLSSRNIQKRVEEALADAPVAEARKALDAEADRLRAMLDDDVDIPDDKLTTVETSKTIPLIEELQIRHREKTGRLLTVEADREYSETLRHLDILDSYDNDVHRLIPASTGKFRAALMRTSEAIGFFSPNTKLRNSELSIARLAHRIITSDPALVRENIENPLTHEMPVDATAHSYRLEADYAAVQKSWDEIFRRFAKTKKTFEVNTSEGAITIGANPATDYHRFLRIVTERVMQLEEVDKGYRSRSELSAVPREVDEAADTYRQFRRNRAKDYEDAGLVDFDTDERFSENSIPISWMPHKIVGKSEKLIRMLADDGYAVRNEPPVSQRPLDPEVVEKLPEDAKKDIGDLLYAQKRKGLEGGAGQKQTIDSVLKSAVEQELIDQEAADAWKFLAKSDDTVDEDTVLRIIKGTDEVTDEMLADEGFKPDDLGDAAIYGQTRHDANRTIITLFTGTDGYRLADATTVAEEWYHRGYHRLDANSREIVKKWHREQFAGNTTITEQEAFAQAGSRWLAGTLTEERHGIRKVFQRLAKSFRRLVDKVLVTLDSGITAAVDESIEDVFRMVRNGEYINMDPDPSDGVANQIRRASMTTEHGTRWRPSDEAREAGHVMVLADINLLKSHMIDSGEIARLSDDGRRANFSLNVEQDKHVTAAGVKLSDDGKISIVFGSEMLDEAIRRKQNEVAVTVPADKAKALEDLVTLGRYIEKPKKFSSLPSEMEGAKVFVSSKGLRIDRSLVDGDDPAYFDPKTLGKHEAIPTGNASLMRVIRRVTPDVIQVYKFRRVNKKNAQYLSHYLVPSEAVEIARKVLKDREVQKGRLTRASRWKRHRSAVNLTRRNPLYRGIKEDILDQVPGIRSKYEAAKKQLAWNYARSAVERLIGSKPRDAAGGGGNARKGSYAPSGVEDLEGADGPSVPKWLPSPLLMRKLKTRGLTKYAEFIDTDMESMLGNYHRKVSGPIAVGKALRAHQDTLLPLIRAHLGKDDLSFQNVLDLIHHEAVAMADTAGGGEAGQQILRRAATSINFLERLHDDLSKAAEPLSGNVLTDAGRLLSRHIHLPAFLANGGKFAIGATKDMAAATLAGLLNGKRLRQLSEMARLPRDMSRRQLEAISVNLTDSNMRARILADLDNDESVTGYSPTWQGQTMAKIDKGASFVGDLFARTTFLNLLTRFGRGVTSTLQSLEMIDAAKAFVQASRDMGDLGLSQAEALAKYGMDPTQAARWNRLGMTAKRAEDLLSSIRAHGLDAEGKRLSLMSEEDFFRYDRLILPEAGAWRSEKPSLYEWWDASISDEVNNLVLTPKLSAMPLSIRGGPLLGGLNVPKWLGQMIHQFQSFAYAFTNQFLPVLSQASNARIAQYLALSIPITAMEAAILNFLSGRRTFEETFSNWQDPEKVGGMIYEVADRSGFAGWLSRPIGVAESAGIGPTRFLGGDGQGSRYHNRIHPVTALAGPTADYFARVGDFGLALANGLIERDISDPKLWNKGVMVMPWRNWIATDAIFRGTQAAGINNPFGDGEGIDPFIVRPHIEHERGR